MSKIASGYDRGDLVRLKLPDSPVMIIEYIKLYDNHEPDIKVVYINDKRETVKEEFTESILEFVNVGSTSPIEDN